VKVVSFSKENNPLDLSSKKNLQKIENKIEETNQQQETLRILLEQKQIADEIRIKIQKENDFLRNERVRLKNEILVEKKNNQQNRNQKEEIKFLEMNLVYGHKCRKSIFNKLYKVGTAKYRECVLNKGLKR
jgi:predicted RNase H-like nuclease (RuvC/YqgF family)